MSAKEEIHIITFEELKAKGFKQEGDAVVIICDDIEGEVPPEELEKLRAAAFAWLVSKNFASHRLGERAVSGAPDAQSGGLPARGDAGPAPVQSYATGGIVRGVPERDGPSAAAGRSDTGFSAGRVVWMDYENWRGERRWRRVLPHSMLRFGNSEYHDRDQWLFAGTDLEDGKLKEWAMSGVHGWEVASDQSLPWREKQMEFPDMCHASHETRVSDASSYDEICVKCGATDIAGGGWGRLRYPCPK